MKNDLLQSLRKGFEGKFRIYLRNLKFGRKNGIFRTEQAKNEEKMQIPYILTDLFWVFCLEDKGFFGRNQIP